MNNRDETESRDLLYPPEIMAKIRIEFVKNQKDMFEKLQATLESGDLKAAFLLVHTLRGSAGLIAEFDLVKLAGETEAVLKKEAKPDDFMLLSLEKELNRVLGIIGVPEQPAFVLSWDEVDKDEIRLLFDKLRASLENSTAECFELIDSLSCLPDMSELITLIERCDFTAALLVLEKLRIQLGM